MRRSLSETALLAILLGALIYLGFRQVFLLEHLTSREEHHMTDPGPMELKASWIHAYVNGDPVYTVISIVRNAPSETITAWEKRFTDEVAAALVDPNRKPVP